MVLVIGKSILAVFHDVQDRHFINVRIDADVGHIVRCVDVEHIEGRAVAVERIIMVLRCDLSVPGLHNLAMGLLFRLLGGGIGFGLLCLRLRLPARHLGRRYEDRLCLGAFVRVITVFIDQIHAHINGHR